MGTDRNKAEKRNIYNIKNYKVETLRNLKVEIRYKPTLKCVIGGSRRVYRQNIVKCYIMTYVKKP